jgi:prophage antirepressor-like protein
MSDKLTYVTSVFEGREIAIYVFRGRPCMIAQEHGATLGYDEGGFRKTLGNWSDELLEGTDIETLTGPALAEFKELLPLSVKMTLSHARSLTILYESGYDLVNIKTEKPEGKRLRRHLADKVIPKLRRGESIGTAAPVPELEGRTRLLALQHKLALEIYATIPGLYSEDFLRHKAEHAAALVTGQAPVVENPLISVEGYLDERGITGKERKSKAPTFGKKVKALYVEQYGQEPPKQDRDINGAGRKVFSYTERDRPLFDRAFSQIFKPPTSPDVPTLSLPVNGVARDQPN